MSESPRAWRPDLQFFFRAGAVAFVVGVVVAGLVQMGAGGIQPLGLLLSGLASLIVFLIVCGGVGLISRRFRGLSGLARAAALTGVFFIAGALAWVLVYSFLVSLGMSSRPTGPEIATNIGVSGLLAILFGSGFYLYELMRQRMVDSASRLKEAEFAEKELALARSIQNSLLPPTELQGKGYRIAARHLAARYVAGDFFDVFAFPDGALGLVVADVAGKGVGASLVMASVKTALPLLAADRSVEETMRALNAKLCDELERRQFVALALARFEPDSGELLLANAGLPDPYLLRPGAEPEPLSVGGPRMPLGLMREQDYRASRVTLPIEGALLLFSDGLPEASTAEGDPLGYEALVEMLPPLASDPGAWLDELFLRVQQGTTPEIGDDWTALLLERHGGR